jgi:hypothetical protein
MGEKELYFFTIDTIKTIQKINDYELNHEKLTKMFYTEFETQEGQRILPHPA